MRKPTEAFAANANNFPGYVSAWPGLVRATPKRVNAHIAKIRIRWTWEQFGRAVRASPPPSPKIKRLQVVRKFRITIIDKFLLPAAAAPVRPRSPFRIGKLRLVNSDRGLRGDT